MRDDILIMFKVVKKLVSMYIILRDSDSKLSASLVVCAISFPLSLQSVALTGFGVCIVLSILPDI